MQDVCAFCQVERVLDVHAEIANRALDPGVAEQDLDGPQLASRLVDDRRVRSPQRECAVILAAQSGPGSPLVVQPGMLPRARLGGVIDPGVSCRVIRLRGTPVVGAG